MTRLNLRGQRQKVKVTYEVGAYCGGIPTTACCDFMFAPTVIFNYDRCCLVSVPVSYITSFARGDTICLYRLQVENIFVFIRQLAPLPLRWLFKTLTTNWPFSFPPWSGVRIIWDVSYLCANYRLFFVRPLCSRLRPNVRAWQTSNRRSTCRSH